MIQSILIVQKFFYSILNNLEGYTTYNSTFLQFIGQYCCGWQDVTEIIFPCGIEVVRMIMWVNAHKVTQNRDMTPISQGGCRGRGCCTCLTRRDGSSLQPVQCTVMASTYFLETMGQKSWQKHDTHTDSLITWYWCLNAPWILVLEKVPSEGS